MNIFNNIIKIYGISRNPDTGDYIIVLQYAEGGNFENWLNRNHEHFNWRSRVGTLFNIINGLKEIHQKRMVHRDFHTGNILFSKDINSYSPNGISYISDMGLCGEVGNIDVSKIYGVMPYVAPEVLRGKPYTQASDIYSFSMIMYYVATGKQPFASSAHDHHLVSNIFKGIRPEM